MLAIRYLLIFRDGERAAVGTYPFEWLAPERERGRRNTFTRVLATPKGLKVIEVE